MFFLNVLVTSSLKKDILQFCSTVDKLSNENVGRNVFMTADKCLEKHPGSNFSCSDSHIWQNILKLCSQFSHY